MGYPIVFHRNSDYLPLVIHMKSTPHDLNITPCQHLNKDILIDMKVD